MQDLEKLAKVLRYAGLNLTPQILQICLDDNLMELVKTLNSRLGENPNLSLEDIDSIIDSIQKAAQKEAEDAALKIAAEAKKMQDSPRVKLEKA